MGAYKHDPVTGLKLPTKKQQLFIDAYMLSFSIEKAAIASGMRTYLNGKRTYELPHVKSIIEERKNIYLQNLGFSRERVIAELCKQSFANIGDFIEWSSHRDEESQRYVHDVVVKDSNDVDTSVIKSVRVNKNGQLEIDMYDKQVALEKLCKILGLNASDKLELTGANGGAIQIEDLRQKLINRINKIAGFVEPNEETGDNIDTDGLGDSSTPV